MVVNPGGIWWISRFIDQRAVPSTGKALPRFVEIDRPGSSRGKKPVPATAASTGYQEILVGLSGLVIRIPLFSQRLTVPAVSESLVSDVVNVLGKKLDRTITKHELGTALVG